MGSAPGVAPARAPLKLSPGGVPRRDWIVLPLISLATILLLFGVAEIVTRVVWPQVDEDSCFVNDSINGYRFLPNCTSRMKAAEGPWTTNHYNECGYRTDAPCGPKPPGTDRLVLMGSSVAQGLFAPLKDSYATKTEHALERQTGRPLQVENLGVFDSSPIYVYRRVGEAIRLQPDAAVFLVSPFDIEQKIDPMLLAQRNDVNAPYERPAAVYKRGWMASIKHAVTESRTMLIAQHFLFDNRETFLKVYLAYGDKADFLRLPLTVAWQKRFADLQEIVGDMESRFHAAGIPFFVVAVPSRAEAALLTLRPARAANLDPFTFGRMVRAIANRSGARYVDLMTPFSHLDHAERLYYVVDGHLTVEGQSLLARHLTNALTPVFVNKAKR